MLRAAPAALTVLAAIAIALFAFPRAGDEPIGRPASSESALAKATALTTAPADSEPSRQLSPTEMRAYVTDVVAQLPYPSGAIDDLQSKIRPLGSGADMSAVEDTKSARMLGEYRAWCTWERYWLSHEGEDRALASSVLATVPRWPTFRSSQIQQRAQEIADAAASGNAAPVAVEARANCTAG